MNGAGGLDRMVAAVARTCPVSDERILAALARVPRHLFVDEALQHRAYSDDALPIGYAQTISKPTTVARMTDALAVQEGDRVLEIGTGSGYQAAVLACLAERVYSVERIGALAVRARQRLLQLGMYNVEVRPGDGAAGWPGEAPFQCIIVTAAAAAGVPPALLEQLAVGGRLVIPLAVDGTQQLQRIWRRDEQRWEEEVLEACHFVPLVSSVPAAAAVPLGNRGGGHGSVTGTGPGESRGG